MKVNYEHSENEHNLAYYKFIEMEIRHGISEGVQP